MYIIKLKTIIFYITAIILVFSASAMLAVPDTSSAEEARDGSALPILMYHAVCKNPSGASRFVISEKQMRQDFEYIKSQGYTAIGSAELIDYAENGTPLPEKPIMITFDDGYYNNYCYAYPLLKEYGFKAIISIIGKYTDLYSETSEENPRYSHITWLQAEEMIDSGLVEIQNHSYNSHTNDKGRNGTKKKKGETASAYAEYIFSDIGKLQEEIKNNLGYTPQVFAYPFGSISEASFPILQQMGFKITLSCEEKVNYIRQGDSLYMLGRFLRSDTNSAEKILSQARQYKI